MNCEIRTFLSISLAIWLSSFSALIAETLVQPDSADPVAGEPLYAENCASCHGDKLQGEANWRSPKSDGTMPAPPHDESGHTWHHTDALLFEYTKLGGQLLLEKRGVAGFKSGMTGFADTMSDDEIWNVIAYLKSTWSDQARRVQKERTDAENVEGN
jgi:mono/diheme cytochrome c family protein